MDPVVARNEIDPLLSELIRQLTADGRATERAIYLRIRRGLRNAQSEWDLTRSFKDLSTMAQMRPSAEGESAEDGADVLLTRILEKTEQLLVATETSPVVH